MATIKQQKYWDSLRGKPTWNKGLKTGLVPKTAFKKGIHASPTTEFKKGISISPSTQFKKGQNVGEKNSSWKGDNAGYHAMHKWIQKYLKKTQACRDCNKHKRLELANISGKYLRSTSDWEWLCHFCNLNKDSKNRRENGRLTAIQFLKQEGRKLP